MTLDAAFRLSSILLAATGFAGLALTGELPVVLVITGASSVVVALADALGIKLARDLPTLSQRAWTGILLAAFGFMIADLIWMARDLLLAGIHFLVVLMVHKLFTLRARKDFLYLHAISMMALLGAAALTVELWYAVVFGVYLLTAIWTLLLYHLWTEAQEARTADAAQPAVRARQPGTITGHFFWSTNGIAVGAFALTFVIFIVTPRIGAGFFEKNRGELIRLSGFSETVDLGMVGAVRLDNTVVMRVEFPDSQGPLAERIYFRGASYDAYDGRSWSNTFRERQLRARSADGEIPLAASSPVKSATGIRQDILVEALDTSVLFGLPFVESVKGGFSAALVDGMNNVFLPYAPAARFQYSVRSVPVHLSPADRGMAKATYPESIRRRFLQLPPMSQRVADLARRIVGSTESPYEQAVAVEQYLKRTYRYSLDVGAAPSVNPVEEFLFGRQTGYCDHFATAMVVLLRTLGIPSRLATGFSQGEWNDVGGYYTIRQRDAHAWVEVYFPNSGWVTFDPTPTVPVAQSHPFFVRIGRYFDSIRLKWDRFVIRYSLRDQMAIAQGVRERGETIRREVAAHIGTLVHRIMGLRARIAQNGHLNGWLVGGGAILMGALAGLMLARGIRAGRCDLGGRTVGPTAQQVAATRIYGRMLQVLRAHGLVKASGTTPHEFAERVAREWHEASQYVGPLTDLYCRARFGQIPLSSEDRARAQALLAGLSTLSPSRPPLFGR